MTDAAGPVCIDAIAIVVPARNEEELLPRCLNSMTIAINALRVASGSDGPSVSVVVVLDSCTDASARVVSRWPAVEQIFTDVGAVGGARRVGARYALRKLRAGTKAVKNMGIDGTTAAMVHSGVPGATRGEKTTRLRHIWLATTDADSAVPESWLTTQLAFARNGTELVLGTVQPDAELPREQQERWLAVHSFGEGHSHIHGSNLGVRADRYMQAGGFAPVDADEDVMLVCSLQALGVREVSTARIPVLTSGRLNGRAPRGFAEYLRQQELLTPDEADPAL